MHPTRRFARQRADCAAGWVGGLASLIPIVIAVSALPLRAAESEAELRRVVAWQIALDRIGFSPGLIDGRVGPKTRLATRAFQRVRNLPQTGRLDDATAGALDTDPAGAFGRYTIVQADLDEIGPAPESWLARSKLKRLGHASLVEVIAEKFHCHSRLLATLNPGLNIVSLKPGDKVIVPAVGEKDDWPRADGVEINLASKVVRVTDEQRRLIGLFHCSVAANESNLPTRDTRVATIVHDPWYTFDPAMYPEVKEGITRKLPIPPGPRNPVGRCWIGLGLPGYGIHGSPQPELIGKTGSHGCFRLTNWDALRLSKMVRVGTPVRFVRRPEPDLAP